MKLIRQTKVTARSWLVLAVFGSFFGVAHADSYSRTIALFRHAHESASFFHRSYGYAVFPTIGKGGIGIGGAFGKGRVYARGRLIGDVSMSQLSVGLQLGGQSYSQMIFFENKGALDEFTSGHFEFGADVGAIAITAAASARAGTSGASAGASAGKKNAATAGDFYHGMVVFTIAKGGLMYQAAVSGQKFSFKGRGAH